MQGAASGRRWRTTGPRPAERRTLRRRRAAGSTPSWRAAAPPLGCQPLGRKDRFIQQFPPPPQIINELLDIHICEDTNQVRQLSNKFSLIIGWHYPMMVSIYFESC
jgi:hypothetical protein